MTCNPFVKSWHYPETINTAGYDRKEEPFDPVAKELCSVAVKGHSFAIDHSVFNYEFHHVADSPGSCNATGKANDEAGNDTVYNSVKNAAIPSGFGNVRAAIGTKGSPFIYRRAAFLTESHIFSPCLLR